MLGLLFYPLIVFYIILMGRFHLEKQRWERGEALEKQQGEISTPMEQEKSVHYYIGQTHAQRKH